MKQSGEALLGLDSGATGAVLSSAWVRNAQLPCICRETPIPISDASEITFLALASTIQRLSICLLEIIPIKRDLCLPI